MTQVEIIGTEGKVRVSSNGELIVRGFDYFEAFRANLNVVDQAFNLVEPQGGKQFVVTGLAISGNRDIGVNGSILVIYDADSVTSLTVLNDSIDLEVPKSTVLPFLQPNIILGEGVFINAKCDDDAVRVSLFGFFVPAL